MQRTVLLLEPDATLRARLLALLESRGYAARAISAPEEVGGDACELLLASVESPGEVEAHRRLRERLADPEVLLLAATPELRATAFSAGFTDCLVKPIDEAHLLVRVEQCLERALLRRERVRLLGENDDLARTHAVTQRCLELLSNPELEWLQERIVSDLSSVCDAQSAALWLTDERGELVLKAYRGLLDRHFLADKLSLDDAQRLRLRDGAPWLVGEGRARNLWVPLVAAGELLGLAQLSDALAGDFTGEHFKSARVLADFAAVGVKNGKKFLYLQRLGLRDRETAAYNLSYFTDYANKEIYKARRYGRTFSLLTFSIDSLNQIRLRLGAEAARKTTRGIIRALSKIIRDSDVLAKATETEFYVLLPETDFFGASMFIRRAFQAVREDPEVKEVDARLPVTMVAGAATFPKDGEDFDELVHRCRRRLEERRASLNRKLHLQGITFWEQVELLLGQPDSPRLPIDDKAEPSRRGKVSDALFEELQTEIARELVRDPTSRGVLYVGAPEIRHDLSVSVQLENVPPDFAARVYLLGRRADLDSHPALTPVFLEGDDRLARHEFILWLSENAAYALVQRRGRGATWGFHTSDTGVVDGLITKLQSEYDLQPY
ncbi:MAG: diguanylate cyclase [Myxococcota bacterium]|nr:diguanylate cyclase [Myxococcota bacterium]